MNHRNSTCSRRNSTCSCRNNCVLNCVLSILGAIIFIGLIVGLIYILLSLNNDIIESVTDDVALYGANEGVVFEDNRVLFGDSIEHVEGTDIFTLAEKGLYSITYSISARNTNTPQTVAQVQVELNGVEVVGSKGYILPHEDIQEDDYQSITMVVLVEIENPSIVRLVNLTDETEYIDPSIIIEKLR